PTGNMDEVFIGINDLIRRIKDDSHFSFKELKYPIIDVIFSAALKNDPRVAEKLLSITNLEEQNKKSENCNLRYIAINKVAMDSEKLKFFGIEYQDYFPINTEEEKKKI